MKDNKNKDIDLDEIDEIEEDAIDEEIETSDNLEEDIVDKEYKKERVTELDDEDDLIDEEFEKVIRSSSSKKNNFKDDSKSDSKSKHRDTEELLDDEEKHSPVAKVVIAIIIIIIIILLLLKACSGKIEEYRVTFSTNGGTAIASLKVKKDNRIEKPEDPKKEGYIFAGWYYNDELFDFSTKVVGDMRLEAKWILAEGSASVTGVTLNQTSISLKVGSTSTLIATVEPTNAKDKSLIWSSSDDSIVTVDENGNIKGIKEGTATITVTTKDGGYKATVTVTVTKEVVAVTGITVSKSTATVAIGSKVNLASNVTISPSDATNKDLIWSSSDPSIATVDQNGRVTGKKEGKVTITVTTKDGGYKATITVTVKNQLVTSVKITGKNTMLEGTNQKLTLTVNPSDASNKKVTWSSSNPSIATVDQNGKVTAIAPGEVTITATAQDGSGKSATIKITVEKKEVVYKIILTEDIDEMQTLVGYKVRVTADGNSFTDYKGITFSNGIGITGNYIQTYDKYTSVTSATVTLNDSTKVSATVTLVKAN